MHKSLKFLAIFFTATFVFYLFGRLYFAVTGGFTVGNISPEFPLEQETVLQNSELLKEVLGQEYTYLGKGCQSYVFLSQDHNYVLKFIKYQRFRPSLILKFFSFIPSLNEYRLKKTKVKQAKLDAVFQSWRLAYEQLSKETGLVYLHLMKTTECPPTVTIRDKLGISYDLPINEMQFLVQRSAKMICPTLEAYVHEGQMDKAKEMIDDLLNMLISEYKRGFADNDQAIMQNTGVIDGKPIHVDVGMFVKNSMVKDPKIYKKELFNKTYKFKKWIETQSQELHQHLEFLLREIIGEDYSTMKPYFHEGGVAKIPYVP